MTMSQPPVRTLSRLRGATCALLLLAMPGIVQNPVGEAAPTPGKDTQEPPPSRWDEVFRRVESTKLHGEETFPVYCVQRLLREELLAPGAKALVIAMGDGRNAVPIAQQGLQVTGLDVSTVALEKAQEAAAKHGVKINALQADMYEEDFGEGSWDLVTNIYYNPAIRIFDKIKAAVRPGGFLLVEGFGADHKHGPPEWSRYRANQLLEELAGWRILEYQDGVFQSDWSGGEIAPVVRVLARKPKAEPEPEQEDR